MGGREAPPTREDAGAREKPDAVPARIRIRFPLVSSELRERESKTPRPSTTKAGTATIHMSARMMPGTISSTRPIPTPMPITNCSAISGSRRGSTEPSTSPTG